MLGGQAFANRAGVTALKHIMPDGAKGIAMLLVLGCAVFLLFVVPYMLFGLGRMIEKATNGRARAMAAGNDAVRSSDGRAQPAWFRRPMQPAFSAPRRSGRPIFGR